MKQIITSLAIIATLALGTSCQKDEPKQKMPDSATRMEVLVKAATLKSTDASTATTITVEECMRRANAMLLTEAGRDYPSAYGIEEERKDYVRNALKVDAIFIILEGKLTSEIGTARDFILIENKLPADTIGYIPNRVIHEAYAKAVAAFNDTRYEDAVKIFTSAFVAHPCTGEQYKALKAQGLN